ncbi:MAG: tRNA (adenosine(37)-N6)-threonylcarbamoyltransferase complex ATPase subunit type 1 TsaE [Candidatus Peregrinibacteria bacterium]
MLFSLPQINDFTYEIAQRMDIFPEGGRILFLTGEMGTGKTTITRKIGEYFGISNITSPTFAVLQSYEGKRSNGDPQKIFHLDLHRADDHRIAEIQETLEESFSSENIYILEWAPESLKAYFSSIPSLSIALQHSQNPDSRDLEISFQNPFSVSVSHAQKMLNEFCTPVHVQKHIEMVRKVAVFCAQKLVKNRIPVDQELVEAGALLHDCVRYVDFSDLENFDRYEEEVTEEKVSLWRRLHEEYKKTHHADAMADILRKREHEATAKVVGAHNTGAIYRSSPFSWEEICVYYGDKRALHDGIVSLKNRLEDGKKRYAFEHSPHLEEKLFALEKKLFTAGNITEEEVMGL